MSQIKFYYAPGACSLAPHFLLREIGAKFEAIPNTVTLDTVAFTEGFHLVNPKMRVPVISIDGNIITETPAVITAISDLAPERHLMGRTPLERIRVYEWMNWLSGTVHGHAFGGVTRPERLSDDPAAYEGIKAKGFKNIKDCLDIIEGKLCGIYAVGGDLTAVDPYLFAIYRWANGMGLKMRENYPKYTALVENLVEYPAIKATLKAEGIKSTL